MYILKFPSDLLHLISLLKKKLKFPFEKKLTIDYVNYLYKKTNSTYSLNFSQIFNNNLKKLYDLSEYN